MINVIEDDLKQISAKAENTKIKSLKTNAHPGLVLNLPHLLRRLVRPRSELGLHSREARFLIFLHKISSIVRAHVAHIHQALGTH